VSAPEPRHDGTCFFEAEPKLSLTRRALAEGIGTFFLVFTALSAGLSWPPPLEAGAIGRALAVAPALTGLILVFGQVSGGHFNPLITLSQTLARRRSAACLVAYLAAQIPAASLGARLATLCFAGPMPPVGLQPPVSPGLLAAELFATAGLMLVVLAAPRMRPFGVGPFAVGGWIAMTIVGLPAAPAANPAITVALLAAGQAAPKVAFAHLAAQGGGLLLALAAIAVTLPAQESNVVPASNHHR
jgi:glycerol uptake facilitator-like aquaporin